MGMCGHAHFLSKATEMRCFRFFFLSASFSSHCFFSRRICCWRSADSIMLAEGGGRREGEAAGEFPLRSPLCERTVLRLCGGVPVGLSAFVGLPFPTVWLLPTKITGLPRLPPSSSPSSPVVGTSGNDTALPILFARIGGSSASLASSSLRVLRVLPLPLPGDASARASPNSDRRLLALLVLCSLPDLFFFGASSLSALPFSSFPCRAPTSMDFSPSSFFRLFTSASSSFTRASAALLLLVSFSSSEIAPSFSPTAGEEGLDPRPFMMSVLGSVLFFAFFCLFVTLRFLCISAWEWLLFPESFPRGLSGPTRLAMVLARACVVDILLTDSASIMSEEQEDIATWRCFTHWSISCWLPNSTARMRSPISASWMEKAPCLMGCPPGPVARRMSFESLITRLAL
mmetsp:Transcript_17016/g.66322  ORF Transcript_17016/g.66322 Transcript_17016/m.66322 type:complete len:401 (-) Transcript_17016:1607-2809(-)